MTDPAPPPLMSRYAIMVDVGYIYAASGELLFSASSRRDYKVDAEQLIHALARRAADQVRGELLRTYWYDAARDRVPTVDQRQVAQMPLVKLRLGNLNYRGQQKGVDAQIRADMETLARHRAITDAILVAGDEDMLPAVEAAQAYGVHVHLWGVEPPFAANQAQQLVWESDTVRQLDRAFLESYFTSTHVEIPGPAVVAAALAAAPGAALAGADPAAAAPACTSPAATTAAGTAGGSAGIALVAAAGRGAPAEPDLAAALAAAGAAGLEVAVTSPPADDDASPAGAPSPAKVFGDRAGLRPVPRPGPAAPVPGAVPVALGPGPAAAAAQLAAGPSQAARFGPDRARVDEVGEYIAHRWIVTRGEDNIRELLPGPILPPVIDRELLVDAEKELGQSLRPYQEAREWLRDAFWARIHREFGIGDGRLRG